MIRRVQRLADLLVSKKAQKQEKKAEGNGFLQINVASLQIIKKGAASLIRFAWGRISLMHKFSHN